MTRIWTERGSRPRITRQQQFINAYIFGAVCPARDTGAAIVMPNADTKAMKLHLNEISGQIPQGKHAAVILDQARWHTTKKLRVPENITLIPLPPYSPELNAQEPVWRKLRDDDLANRCFDSYENIVDACCNAWNKLTKTTNAIQSLCSRKWAVVC